MMNLEKLNDLKDDPVALDEALSKAVDAQMAIRLGKPKKAKAKAKAKLKKAKAGSSK